MKKRLVSLLLLAFSLTGFSQTNKTAYVDVYYILEKSPEYKEANLELEKRAKDWQTQITSKKDEIKKLKDALATERALLTQQLVDEKEDEIKLIEKELNTFQHEKFGTDGDYTTQHKSIYKPLLDQIHTITNDIALKKRMDIVLVKSEENTMIYASKRNDLTELVLKEMERTRTRGKMSKKEIATLEIQDKIDERKDLQREKRDILKQRQKELEAGNLITSSTDENNSESTPVPTETEAEKRMRLQNEKMAAIKQKQAEQKALQLKRIEEQKLAIEKKKEDLRLMREKAKQDLEDKKKNLTKNSNTLSSTSSSSTKKELTPKQQEMLQLKEQRVKEAKAKREAALAERKAAVEKRKKEAQEAREKKLKELEESKNKK